MCAGGLCFSSSARIVFAACFAGSLQNAGFLNSRNRRCCGLWCLKLSFPSCGVQVNGEFELIGRGSGSDCVSFALKS